MKSWYVHYMNKYPGGRVHYGEDNLDVYDAEGAHRLSVKKNGAGQWNDVSEELGLPDRHDLSPIPRDSRVHKLHKDGKVGLDELHVERRAARDAFVKDGKVLSENELAKVASEAKS